MAYTLIIIGILVGAAVGFGVGYLAYVPQINSLNSKVTNLQVSYNDSIITLASNSPPFFIGAAGTLKSTIGTVLSTFEKLYPTITVAPPYLREVA